jgi:excisionase family DNA binding protein
MNPHYTAEEAAHLLDLPIETINRYCRQGRFSAHHDRGIMQKGWVIRKDDFHAYLEKIDEAWRIPAQAVAS